VEDTELASAEFADSGDRSVPMVSFNSRTLELVSRLGSESQYLADMLKGAWATLDSSDNPDVLAQAAHSMRELIEKAPYLIARVPILSQDPGTLVVGETRRDQIRLLVTAYVGNDGQTSEQILEAQTEDILTLRVYFVDVSHHRQATTIDDIKQKITELENILFNFISPQSIEDLDELDALMAQGEPV
jgi:hypothetical protein